MSELTAGKRIRSLRPPKAYVDPYKAHSVLLEDERRPNGTIERALTVFLAGAECPFTCSFCDLWRFTIEGPTPRGALTAQLEAVLDGVTADRLKLYNASNFFDARAVPMEDVSAIAKLADSFAAVTVESHVNTIDMRALEFAREIHGRLEVAVGLETIHPVASSKLNKRFDLARFDVAARFLLENSIDLRVFVLLGVPHIPSAASVSWTVNTVEYAVARGAAVVSIIPVRGGNGEMDRLERSGDFISPTLSQLEDVLDRCLPMRDAVIMADLWDIERFSRCDACVDDRVARLRRLNLSGLPEARVSCDKCGVE